jgi:hypothetical protein
MLLRVYFTHTYIIHMVASHVSASHQKSNQFPHYCLIYQCMEDDLTKNRTTSYLSICGCLCCMVLTCVASDILQTYSKLYWYLIILIRLCFLNTIYGWSIKGYKVTQSCCLQGIMRWVCSYRCCVFFELCFFFRRVTFYIYLVYENYALLDL